MKEEKKKQQHQISFNAYLREAHLPRRPLGLEKITLMNSNQLKTAWRYSPQVTFRLSQDHKGLLCYNIEGDYYHIHNSELTSYEDDIRLVLLEAITLSTLGLTNSQNML